MGSGSGTSGAVFSEMELRFNCLDLASRLNNGSMDGTTLTKEADKLYKFVKEKPSEELKLSS
jgi:hypothetical protein